MKAFAIDRHKGELTPREVPGRGDGLVAIRNAYVAAVAAGRGDDYVPMLSDFVAAQNGTKLTG